MPDSARDSAAPLQTQRRIAIIAAAIIVVFQWLPGQDAVGAISLAERMAVAATFIAFAVGTRVWPALQRHGVDVFEALLYGTGLWSLRIAAAQSLSPGSVLTLLVATFGLGLCFRNADRLARFYLLMLGAVATLYVWLRVPAQTEPILVLSVLGAIMTVAYVVARARDEALHEARVLSLVASHVHNGVVMTDGQGRITWINDGYTRMSGRQIDDVRGRQLVDTLDSPPTHAGDLERLRQAVAQGRPLTIEAARLRADGTPLWIAIDLSPVRSREGTLERYIGIETDVTAAHAYVAEIQDAMSDLLLVVNADGTIRSANRAACERLEDAPDALVGSPLSRFLLVLPSANDESQPTNPGSGPLTERLLAAIGDPRRPIPVQGLEVGLQGRAGAVVAVHVTMSDLPATDELPRRVVLVARDVSQRRRLDKERVSLEKKARQAQKLESLGVLAGGIAHDFNNLLVGVLGNASLLRDQLAEEPERRELIERIEEAAERAADLTRQMLAYSGRGRFVIEPIHLGSVAEEMRRLVSAAVSKRARIVLDLAQDLPAVEGDATQIRQVVMNLLTNAADALEDQDGVITLRTGVVVADRATLAAGAVDDDLPTGRYVFLEVTDTGAGMSEVVRRRMFEPFFTTKATGRGLGLAATLGIVRGHRGTIRVTSEPGCGTTTTILLPASDRPFVPPPASSAGAVRGPAPHALRSLVLVADDEPAVLEFVRDVLRSAGADVLTARDGVECVEQFAAHADEIALVILDLTMPRMSGEEAMRALRHLRPDVRVLLSSGYNEHEANARFAAEGVAGFLQKPYRARHLLSQVRSLLPVQDVVH